MSAGARRTALRTAAVLALAVAAPAAPVGADAGTEIIPVLAVRDGRPAPGYTEQPGETPSGCMLGLVEAGDHIYTCPGGAAPAARVCWDAGRPALLCLADPADPDGRNLQRVTSWGVLPPAVNTAPRRPFAMRLGDGTRCTVAPGAPDRADTDDALVDYSCDTDRGPVAVARTAGRPALDQAGPEWTVRLAGDEATARPVRTAWIATTG